MSIREDYSDHAVYCTGWLIREAPFVEDGYGEWPRPAHGSIRNECGMANVSIDYYRRPRSGNGFLQIVSVDATFNGRTYDYSREATKPDWVTEEGAKRIAHRWLRDLHQGVK